MDRTTYDFNSEKIAPKCRVKSNSEEFGKKKKKTFIKTWETNNCKKIIL